MSGTGTDPEQALRVGVAVPAAGTGVRMGGVKKAFLKIDGRPVLAHALSAFLEDERVVAVAVALAPEDATSAPEWLTGLDPRIRIVAGGATRTQSVRAALASLPDDLDVIAVHDAARPLVPREVVSRCLELAGEGHGAVAGSAAVDTMKFVDASGRVVGTPDRATMWHAHTPQAFPARLLRAAYASPGAEGTDDSELVERHAPGTRVEMVDDGGVNLKVTRPRDVRLAAAILEGRPGRDAESSAAP